MELRTLTTVARKKMLRTIVRITSKEGVAGSFEVTPKLWALTSDEAASDAKFLSQVQRAVRQYHPHSSLLFHSSSPPPAAGIPSRVHRNKIPKLSWDARTRIGCVTLFTHVLTPDNQMRPDNHVGRVHRALAKWQAAGMVGLIIDLRKHHGGTYRVGLHAIGGFLLRGSHLMGWTSGQIPGCSKDDQLIWYDGEKEHFSKLTSESWSRAKLATPFEPLVPVAVLIGRGTSSSGEIIAAALHKKPRIRSFGEATGGALSVNGGYIVAPGIELLLTARIVCTMDGACHLNEELLPDQKTMDPMGEAIAWLLQQQNK